MSSQEDYARYENDIIIFQKIFLSHGCCYSVTKSCPTLQPHKLQQARLPCLSLSPSLHKCMSIESVMSSNHLILCLTLLLLPFYLS